MLLLHSLLPSEFFTFKTRQHCLLRPESGGYAVLPVAQHQGSIMDGSVMTLRLVVGHERIDLEVDPNGLAYSYILPRTGETIQSRQALDVRALREWMSAGGAPPTTPAAEVTELLELLKQMQTGADVSGMRGALRHFQVEDFQTYAPGRFAPNGSAIAESVVWFLIWVTGSLWAAGAVRGHAGSYPASKMPSDPSRKRE